MLQNTVDFKAKSFLTERNTSTIAYEVKGVRALWDPSLSIPGTNRRGGWRCPIGTRYGGQITDRFGRSCGWGIARRIANQISDIGDRLENVDDARRGRRIARRERRILGRLNPEGGGAGRLERGLRGVAERLDGGDAPSPSGERRRTVVARPPSVDAPETPRELTPAPPTPRAPRRRRAPNLRESEQRRMDREIEQPGAPRTGEVPARPARRRRRAVVEATQNPKAPKQQEENAVEKPVVEPKIVKPRRPRPVPRGESDNAARSEEVRAEAARRDEPEMPDWGGLEWDPAGEGKLKKGDWTMEVLKDENGKFRGLKATRSGLGPDGRPYPTVGKFYTGAEDADAINRFVIMFENNELGMRVRQAQPARPKTPAPARPGLVQRADLNKVMEDNGFVERINRDVIGARLRIINDPNNFPDVSATDARANALERAEREILANQARLGNIERAIRRVQIYDTDVVEGANEVINVRKLKEELNDVIEAWKTVRNHNAPKIDPIDAPFLEPKTEDFLKQFRKAPALIPKRTLILPDVPNIEYLGSPIEIQLDNPEIPDSQKLSSALEKAQKAINEINDPLVNPGESPRYSAVRIGNKLYVVLDADRVAREENWNRDSDEVSDLFGKERVVRGVIQNGSNPIDDPFKTPKPVEPIEAGKIAYKQPELDAIGDDVRKKILDGVIDKINNSNLNDRLKKLEIRNAQVALEELKYHNDEFQAEEIRIQQKALLKVLEQVQSGVSVETALELYRGDFEGKQGLPGQMRTLVAMKKSEVDAAWELLNRADAGDQTTRIRNLEKKIQSYVSVKKRLELHERFETDLTNAISRIRQGQVLDESKGTLANKTPDEIVAQVRVDIDNAVQKRGKKLDEYLEDKWKDSAVRPKFEDMTPEKWQTLTSVQKKQYITEAYSHKLIKGKNGKFYSAVVSEVDGQNRFEVAIEFNEVDKDGNIIRTGIANARRSSIDPAGGSVYQQSFFIHRDSDKGADIGTIFNQQAFLYLKNIGITRAGVGPADDGQYVWGRVGFKTDRGVHTREQFASISEALNFYKKFGPGGLIATDEQYFKVKKLLELAKGGTKVNHQDFHFAVDAGKEMLDKARRDYIKHWFSKEVPVTAASLDFGDQKIGAFVSPRNKKKVTKKI